MYCNYCGKVIQDDAAVCAYCGIRVGASLARTRLVRPRLGRKVGGVCLGFAEYFDIDVTVVRLSIGESGQVDGSIHAEQVEVRGRVAGSITAKQVRLYASAHIDGDITHEQLTIEAGAFFQGRSLRFQRTAAPLAATGDVIEISAAS